MTTIAEVIESLAKFSDKEGVSALIADLRLFSTAANTPSALFEKSRNQLISLMSQTAVIKDNITLAAIAHKGLLAFAEFKPENNEDPILKDSIEPDDVVFTSTGHKFSISNLIQYHNSRYYSGAKLGEHSNSKWLLNPFTNQGFDLMDVAHIQRIAQQKGLQILDLRILEATPAVVDEPILADVDTGKVSLPESSLPSSNPHVFFNGSQPLSTPARATNSNSTTLYTEP